MALWSYGFRPFFLAAGLLAVLIVPWWAAALAWGLPLATRWPPSFWHGHEMLFGFIVAAIAGFLLTAVPSWTGERGFAGWPLIVLGAIWGLGRIAAATSWLWPAWVVAVVDLSFLPALAALVLPPLLRERNRNTPLLAVLMALWATNIAFHWGISHGDGSISRHALLIGIDIVLVLTTVIGGRIIPAFTNAALKQAGDSIRLHSWPAFTPLTISAMVIVTLIDLLSPDGKLAGLVALIASALQLARLVQWRGLRTHRFPIVWVLHLGYLWLPVGLLLKALLLLAGAAFAAFYLHALTIGAATTLILAVMTRASLGHTGRRLAAARPTVWAYVLLTSAAVVRVWGPALIPLSYIAVILTAAVLWTGAFVLFLAVYAPILLTPRVDGKPG